MWPDAIQTFDERLFLSVHRWLHGLDSNVLHEVLRTTNELGSWPAAVVFAGIAALVARDPGEGVRRVAASVLAAGIAVGGSQALKALFGRPRPQSTLADAFAAGTCEIPFGEVLRLKSFPSGHATTAFALATLVVAWTRGMPRGQRIFATAGAYLLATSTGVARVYAGAHFPIDVAVGAVLGVMAALAALAIVGRFRPRATDPPALHP